MTVAARRFPSACSGGSDPLKCCHYLIHKVHLLDYHKAKNRYSYLIKMINNDIKNPDDMQ